MKFLPENKTARGFIVPAYIVLPVYAFVFFLIPDGRLFTLIMFGAIYIYLVIYGFVTDKRGKEKRVLQKKPFTQLIGIGFKFEEKDKYCGYKGVYRKYFFRIYYTNEAIIPDHEGNSEVVLLLYYASLKGYNEEDVEAKLSQLNSQFNKSFLTLFILECENSIVTLHMPFTYFTTLKNIQTQMDKLVDVATREKLNPVAEKELEGIIKENVKN